MTTPEMVVDKEGKANCTECGWRGGVGLIFAHTCTYWLKLQIKELKKTIPMVLCCPQCGEQHIDRVTDDWDNPPHKTHQCEFCEHHWRPADVCTNGVKETQTFGRTADRGGAVSTPLKVHIATITKLKAEIRRLYQLHPSLDVVALNAEIEQLKAEMAETDTYARNLATTLWEKHYEEDSPNWKLIDSTLGVLTQIDNITAGLSREQLKSPWVPISERMPTKDDAPTGEVLWARSDSWWREVDRYNFSKEDCEELKITRWMPIPPIPDTPEGETP